MLLLVCVVLVISGTRTFGLTFKQENVNEESRSIVRAETPTEDNIYVPKIKAEVEVGGHPVDRSPWSVIHRDAPDLDLRLNSAPSSENKIKRNRTTQRKKFTLKQDQIADQSNGTSQGKLPRKKKKQPKQKKPSLLSDTSIPPESSTQSPEAIILTEDPVEILQDQPQYSETDAQYTEELRRRQEIRRRHEQERQKILELRRQLEEERRFLDEERRRDEYERRRLHNRPQVPSPTDSQAVQQNILSSPSRGSDQSRQQQSAGGRPHSQTDTSRTGLGHHQDLPQSSSGAQQPATSVFSRYTRQPLEPAAEGSHIIPNQRPPSSAGLDPYRGQIDPQLPLTSYRGYTNSASVKQYDYDGQGQWYYPQRGSQESSYYQSYQDPVAFSTCPDTGIDLRINGLGCQQAVAQFGASLCYLYEYRSRECCQVCLPRKVPTRTGCEYGDHTQQCSSITAADCYEVRNRQVCCETCERLRRRDAAVGCEYGDMSPRCDVIRQNPGLCYRPDNQRVCCQSCGVTRNTTNPGCPWGDYDTQTCQVFDGQTANVRLNCYLPQRRRFCCQACERLRQWLPANLPEDCQFGDRPVLFTTSHFGTLNCSNIFNYFRTEECRSNPAVYVNCCYTCHRYLTGQG